MDSDTILANASVGDLTPDEAWQELYLLGWDYFEAKTAIDDAIKCGKGHNEFNTRHPENHNPGAP